MTRFKTLLSLMCSAIATVILFSGAALASENVTIVHFNDLDRMNEDDGRGGVARLASVINNERAKHENVLVTFGGDAISPSLMSGLDEGAHMIDLLNQLDLTAMVIGNHEYDFGPDVTRQRISEATFPMLATNNINPEGMVIEGALPSIVVDVGDFKIGILGLTTVGTLVKSSPGNIHFDDPVEAAMREANQLRQEDGADLVIALAHTDVKEDAALMASGAVELLLSGDDHLLRTEFDGNMLFAESGEQAEFVTVIDLAMDRVKKDDSYVFVWSAEYRIVDTAKVEPNATITAKVNEYEGQLSEELNVELGVTKTAMDTRRATVRGREAAFGNLVADALREATGADLAAANGGGIRADRQYEPGTVLTRRDIVSELPFGNSTVVLEITGQDFVNVLENGFSEIEKGAGRFLQISGAMVKYNPSREPGQRVIEVTVDGQPIELAKTYSFAINDYVANGGDGYAMLADKVRIVDEYAAVLMTVQVFNYIMERGEISPVVEGRLQIVQ